MEQTRPFPDIRGKEFVEALEQARLQCGFQYGSWLRAQEAQWPGIEQALLGRYVEEGNPRMLWSDGHILREAIRYVPAGYAKAHYLFPFHVDGDTLSVAVADPLSEAAGGIALQCKKRIVPYVATCGEIEAAIARYYEDRESRGVDSVAEDAPVDQTKIGGLIHHFIEWACQWRASDLHFETTSCGVGVRFRVDGLLHEVETLDSVFYAPLMAKLKLMANLDIAEKRRPQDGRFQWQKEQKVVDCRLSLVPGIHGECAVIRLLDPIVLDRSLQDLGFLKRDYKNCSNILQAPDGLFLVTGPTGAGKTTTLYTVLRALSSSNAKVVTLEDPIEYKVPGITQVAARRDIPLTFATALRAILRQAPDILTIGEIRDPETAEIATQAALCGHKVFSTLHTRNVLDSCERLQYLGVAPCVFLDTLRCILSQRLVRKLCRSCAQPYSLSALDKQELGLSSGVAGFPRKAIGCPLCLHTGFHGRTGIFELLTVEQSLHTQLTNCTTYGAALPLLRQAHTHTLLQDAACKVLGGCTTIDEIRSVLF